MEYFNILTPSDNFTKHDNILINIGNINQKFSWHTCKINDTDFNKCVCNNLFIETPLILVNKLVKSSYNNKYYLEINIPNNDGRDYENFNKNLNFIFELFDRKMEEYLSCNNIESQLKLSDDNKFKIFIDMSIKPLLYFDDMQTINFQLNNDFRNKIENSKIKCIIKPLLWSCKKGNEIVYGIKYVMCQCIISKKKNITDSNVSKEKILNLRDISDNICSICHDCIIESGNNYDNSITKLPCNHKFHFKCINNWYTTQMSNNRNFTCPCCRGL